MQRKLDNHIVLKGQRNLYHFSSTNPARVTGMVMTSIKSRWFVYALPPSLLLLDARVIKERP
jgi:hypothetical protein